MLIIQHQAPQVKTVQAGDLAFGLCRHEGDTVYVLRDGPTDHHKKREAVILANGFMRKIGRGEAVEPLTATMSTKHLEVHP